MGPCSNGTLWKILANKSTWLQALLPVAQMVTSLPQVMLTEPSRYGSSTTSHSFINSDANTRSQILLSVPIIGGCMISKELSVMCGDPKRSFACLTLINAGGRQRVS